MEYYLYSIEVEAAWRDILLGFLSTLPFDSFEEKEHGLSAFLPAEADRKAVESKLDRLKEEYPFDYRLELIPHQNWNALWESNFEPIRVDDFCGLRADFHSPFKDVKHELVINPRMAFGTGHHETTFMMIQQMRTLDFSGAAVLDYGTGTGILAILAAKMGASSIEAVDIEEAAYENTLENAEINGVADAIEAVHGSLEDCTGKLYDIILANINRNVILTSLSALYNKLSDKGTLLVSGVLTTDEQQVIEKARSTGFRLDERRAKGEWCCMRFSIVRN